ncbi:MAG: hypothetical protein NVSMB9_17070 [Isosphaeraceae bacterium]
MGNRRNKADVLNRDFLEMRCRVIDIAASLDRLDRAPRPGSEAPDPRIAQLRQALEALLEPGPGRTETIQRIFSREYESGWRQYFGLSVPRQVTEGVEA